MNIITGFSNNESEIKKNLTTRTCREQTRNVEKKTEKLNISIGAAEYGISFKMTASPNGRRLILEGGICSGKSTLLNKYLHSFPAEDQHAYGNCGKIIQLDGVPPTAVFPEPEFE